MRKYYRDICLGLSVLVLTVAGCRQKTDAPQPAQSSTHYTQIDAANSGTIAGTIHFTGTAPTPIAIDMAQDPACDMATKTPNMTEQYVVHNGRMANVFVYVKDGLGNRVYMPTKAVVVLDQRGCRYIPHVIGAMVGQPVEFRNSDATMHNVHVVPPNSQDAAGFDISEGPMGNPEQHSFRSLGLMVPVRCNLHPWMEGFLNLVKNPFFAVSGTDGHFEIKDLPPGTYTLAAVQEKLGTKSKPVTVGGGKTTTVDFTFSK